MLEYRSISTEEATKVWTIHLLIKMNIDPHFPLIHPILTTFGKMEIKSEGGKPGILEG